MSKSIETVGDLIYHCRMVRGLSQQEAAERIGVDQSHYYKIESGKTKSPGVLNVKRFLEGLGFTLHLSAIPHEEEQDGQDQG